VEVPDPLEVLSEQNRALLSYFASEVARYLEAGMETRLEGIEVALDALSTASSREEATAVREIIRLFSRHRLFRVLGALSDLAVDDKAFTKNVLIRRARVGQGFRSEGLDRLVDVLCQKGMLLEVGRKGRGSVYCVTGLGKRFFASYLPKSVLESEP
jgi:hypothetical protein